MTLLKKFIRGEFILQIAALGYLPRWIVLIIDLLICSISFYISYIITSRLYYMEVYGSMLELPLAFSMIATLGVQIIFFYIFHTYSGIIRYSNYTDAMRILISVVGTAATVVLIHFIITYFGCDVLLLRVTLVFYVVFSFLLLFLLRLVVKTTYDQYILHSGIKSPVLIYGTKSAAIAIAKMLRSSATSKYKVVGFLDKNINVAHQLLGLPVFDIKNNKELHKLIKKAGVRDIIISPLKIEGNDYIDELDDFLNQGIKVLTVPPIKDWKDDAAPELSQLKTINIELLLNRKPITISNEHIFEQLTNKVVLVTGAAGSIGSEIVRQISKFNPKIIILTEQAESPLHDLSLDLRKAYPKQRYATFLGDVRNKRRMKLMFETYQPDIIYHCAAYKHVPLIEDNPSEGVLTNIYGTMNMADLANEYKVERFVMVSTDKAVNPTNVMGATKRIAEIYVQSLYKEQYKSNKNCTKFITTRFGNVLGSNGSVIPFFKKQIEQGGPVTVTHPEIIRYFMTIPEACQLVLEAGCKSSGGEIFIFDMGTPVKIVDLARKMITLAGFKPEVDIKIEFSGLRPGEKLYEELLNDKEKTKPTHHEKIMIAAVQEYNYNEIKTEIELLIKYAEEIKNYLVVKQMKKIVPEFISQNSPYESLD